MKRHILKRSLLLTIPVMMGYVVLGIAFGLLLHSIGYNWVWALGISVFVFAGSMQFVLVGLLAQQAPLVSVALTTVLVNSRHLFYGLSFIERFKAMGKRGLYMIFALTDETYALLCSVGEGGPKEEGDALYFSIALLHQIYWVTGSVVGSLLGSIIRFNITGIEFAMSALFSVIVVEQWLEAKNHLAPLIAAATASVMLLVVGPEQFLLPTLIVTVILLFVLRSKLEEEKV
ncbi:MAG: AzlC family ABC transporter permease [Sphaerochaetaceae bacterium]